MRSNEEELDLFAELIDPVAEILADKELADIVRSGKAPIKAAKPAIKNHKQAIITILAVLDDADPKQYRVPAPGILLLKVISVFSRPEIQELFTLQVQNVTAEFSGPAMVNIEDGVS